MSWLTWQNEIPWWSDQSQATLLSKTTKSWYLHIGIILPPYKYLLVPSPASPMCTIKPKHPYIFGNPNSQGRFAEIQNFPFLICISRTKPNCSCQDETDYQGCCNLTNFKSYWKLSCNLPHFKLLKNLLVFGFDYPENPGHLLLVT